MEDDIVDKFDKYYDQAYTAWSAWYPEAEKDLRFYLGDQWDQQEKRDLFQEGRNAFVFNMIRRSINLVTGYQRKNRLSSVVAPVEDGDQQTADQFSKLLLQVMQSNNGYQYISDAFAGALKTGFNMLCLWMDYRDDPLNGDIKISREPYSSFIIDPYFTSTDLSDCGYILKRKYLSLEQTKSMLPGKDAEIERLYKQGWQRDDKFSWLPYQRESTQQEMLAVSEMYEKKWKTVKLLVDQETGEHTEWEGSKADLDQFLSLYPQIAVTNKSKQYIERHVIVNNEHVETEENPFGLDDYPFVPFIGIFEPESDEWELKMQSLVRCMRDPQREANRRRSQMIDIMDSQVNSGWIAKENTIINPRSLFQTSQGKVIWKNQDAPPDALEKIQPAQIPPSMFQLQQTMDQDIMQIAGINDAAFGNPESGNESGLMMMLRQGSAITNLQDLFDNLRYSQKLLSKKVIQLIQTWTPQKVQRILNDQPSQQFYDKNFAKYDVVVQEGILTDSQRQMYFRQLVELQQMGVQIPPDELLKAAPIQGKTELIEAMSMQQQQQAQQAQAQQELEMELRQSQQELAKTQAISNLALSKERSTRAQANMGLESERASQAVENRSDAALQRAKTLSELQDMDLNRLDKLLQILKAMEVDSMQQEEQIRALNDFESEEEVESILPSQAGGQMPQQEETMPQEMAPEIPGEEI